MLTAQENELFTRIGPGTPMGEMLRRYWHPVGCRAHGWLYDRSGRCLEQPPEPEGSSYRDKIKLASYQTREFNGLIFGYLGPDPAPLLPHYDVMLMEDGVK